MLNHLVMISFIIPAWNEEELIGSTIESIKSAIESHQFPYEIIVADDASDDNTAMIAASLGAIVVPCNNRQIAATRNAGALASSGTYLVFVDADTFVPHEVVRETLEAFKTGAVAGGSYVVFDGNNPLYIRWFLGCMKVFYRMFGLVSGAYLFCTREAFDAVGGFNENLYAAEEAFMSRSLHSQGRFHILRSTIITSGRKLRTYSVREILTTMVVMAIPFTKGLQKRHSIWYGERRLDIEQPKND